MDEGGSWRMAEAGVRRREEEVGGRGWRRLENGEDRGWCLEETGGGWRSLDFGGGWMLEEDGGGGG